ncbi:hypothetical protein [Methylobacterium soli]|uniref:Tetratricopeptide repeat protein n=1 Tax=Methylobacterium soli TaxID=553447 RepID=A0A6L3SQP0_9HYPH|nr:hypothetical protein [Methylobacterium soli]KAB1073819.1 hypothetical protein F6X53_26470 [Methylobacterium soli]GJE41544.1 hypothetical protein AEGHOMDF_0710 [Methylobacterium soli]
MTITKGLAVIAILICAIAGYALQSGPEERIAMLVRDGRQAEAKVEIEAILQSGQAKPRVLMQLALLQEAAGDPVRATELLELYVLARPHDRDALAWLVKTYDASDNARGLVEALTKLAAVEPTRERIARLAGLHRYEGRYDEERSVLERFPAVVDKEPEMLERLGGLLAAEGRAQEAVAILRRADALAGDDGERVRKLLFELLLQTGAYDEAAQRAQSWLTQWRKPWLASQLTLRLAAKAPFEAGRSLGEASAALHPDARLYLARILAEQGNRRIAGALLAGWPFADQPLNKQEIEGYVAASVAAGDTATIWATFARLRARPDLAEAQALFAEAAASHFGMTSIALLQPPLPLPVLRARPIFAARLALHRGETRIARTLLASADPAAMPEAERSAWLDLLLRTNTARAAFQTLHGLRQRHELPATLIPAYRSLAAQLGLIASGGMTLASTRDDATAH